MAGFYDALLVKFFISRAFMGYGLLVSYVMLNCIIYVILVDVEYEVQRFDC